MKSGDAQADAGRGDVAKVALHEEWILAARSEAAHWRGRRSAEAAAGASETQTLIDALSATLTGYELGQLIQRGGQGVVLRGVQRGTGRQVAIKVLGGGAVAGPQHRARFEREVRILAGLKHPNIVTILDSGSAAGHFYYIMDYIAGPALDRFVIESKLSIPQIVELFIKICDAMNAAHLRGIIHRDLKPGNVRVDHAGEPHILDFGLAKVDDNEDGLPAGQARTQTGEFIGSPPWASPEQVEGSPDRIDVRTDVYSLGIMLYQALTGEFPYDVQGQLRTVLENICTAEPMRPTAHNRQVDDELEAIVLTCLRKLPDARYQSAGELARDLRAYLRGEPIQAKRDSSWYLLRKSIRRHRGTAAFAVLIAALVLTVAGGSTLMYRREARLRVQAIEALQEAARQAGIAEAVNTFLNEDILAAARPEALGRDATIATLVDRAAANINDRFADEPLVEAAIRDTLGDVYMEMGTWAEALVHAERALALRRSAAGDEAEETLAAMNLVGRLYRRLGRYEAADALYREMIATAERALGPEHPLRLRGMHNYAYVLYQLGRHQDAYEMNKRVLNVRLRTLGEEDEETLSSLNNDAYYSTETGSIEAAEAAYGRVYSIRRRVLGPEHPDTLMSMHNLAAMRSRLDRLEEARQLEEEYLRIADRVLGPRHAGTVESRGVLGEVYRKQGRLSDAETIHLEALEILRENGGERHPQMSWLLRSLARVYADQQRHDDAESVLGEALEILNEHFGERHVKSAVAQVSLGEFYLKRGRLNEAKELLSAAHEVLQKSFGSNHTQTREAADHLARLQMAERTGDQP